jgi:glyoxylase-like metal-dependent hydrolase (beta-lactamase superfamily II)
MAESLDLPSNVHVFVRDWLSANNILLKSPRDGGHVLVDSGYGRHAPLTLSLLASHTALGQEPLAKLVNTHCHSDHMGGNAAIKARYRCPVALPEGEAILVERWDEKALLLGYCDQRAERFTVDERLHAGEVHTWGELEWQALGAPGHSTNALVFFNPEHGILISGDALWERGYGFVLPPALDHAALPAARATLDMISRLDIRIVIPGHGAPFADVGKALENAFRRTQAFEADEMRMAWHAVKVILVFALLDQRRLALSSLPHYLARIGFYVDINRLYLKLSPQELAETLVAELVRSGAVRQESGWLMPAAS